MAKSILIVGAGRFGRYSAQKLHELGHDVMVVDMREELINQIMPYVSDARIGDSTDKAFMNTLGVHLYDFCIVTIGDDFLSSLQTTFTLDELGAKKVIARATSHRQEKFLLRNGADAVVFPERELGYWTAIRYSSENISDYVELSDGYAIFEIKVPDRWSGKRIVDLDVRRKFHINILGIRSPGQNETFSRYGNGVPNERPKNSMNMDVRFDTVLHQGETLLVLGLPEHIQKVL
jgi:trk system potassium uptake protein TrkA